MVSCIYLEEILYTLSYPRFLKIWGPFIEHIRRERDNLGTSCIGLYLIVFLLCSALDLTLLAFILALSQPHLA